MPLTTPLLRLLDAVISQDDAQIQPATNAVRQMLLPFIYAPELITTANLAEVIRLLLRQYPSLASASSIQDGSLPLHFAASLGNVGVASVLYSMYPQAASTANKKGKIPLHYAAREGRTDMVQFLLQVNPYTASIPSKKQKLALHFAAGDGHIQVVRALLRVNPEGASAPSKKGKIPLHFAARWGHMKVAQDLLYVYPSGVSCLDWEGSLPLHDAARDGQTIMAQFLLERHPQGLSTANLRGEIPLFPAVRSGNIALVICLLKAWPMGGKHILQHVNADDNIREWEESIVELCLRGAAGNFNNCTILDGHAKPLVGSLSLNPDKSSPNHQPNLTYPSGSDYTLLCSPLQDAMADNSTSPVQDYRPKSPLVEERESKKRSPPQIRSTTKRSKPESVSETSDFPCCPGTHRLCGCEFYHLHAALSSGASASVLQVVMERFGEQQLRLTDCQGQLPIHIAMANTKTDDAINIVLDQVLRPFPEAATIRDKKARLPLHVGLYAQADFRLVNALLELHPLSKVETCDTRDARYANKAPLWMATGCDCDLSTVYSLLLGDPSVLNDLRL